MSSYGTTHVKKIMTHLSKNKGWEYKLMQCALFDNWQKIVPDEIHNHAVPLKITNNVLWLEVENSIWIQQLQFAKLTLLDTVNEFLHHSPITDIRFVLGDKKKEQKETSTVKFVAPAQEKIEAFEEQISFIQDTAIRDALMRFWYLCNGCKRDEASKR